MATGANVTVPGVRAEIPGGMLLILMGLLILWLGITGYLGKVVSKFQAAVQPGASPGGTQPPASGTSPSGTAPAPPEGFKVGMFDPSALLNQAIMNASSDGQLNALLNGGTINSPSPPPIPAQAGGGMDGLFG